MYYTIYKITNKISGKHYIGAHKTADLQDDYVGSGTYLKRAIKKHGWERFEKDILHVFDNPEDMYNKEAELVNEEFVLDSNTYNLKIGGEGGWDYINSNIELRKAKNKKAMEIANENGASKNGLAVLKELRKDKHWHSEVCNKISDSRKKYINENGHNWDGKNHSNETKKLMSEKAKERKGEKNSQYGSMWIHNKELKQCKKISKDDLIPKGWEKGRKMKF